MNETIYLARESDNTPIGVFRTLDGAREACDQDWSSRSSSKKPALRWFKAGSGLQGCNPAYGATIYWISEETIGA